MSREMRLMKHEWMVRYTPHEAWISGKGLYLWLAFFFTEIFAGIYFVSLFVSFPLGLLAGWLGCLVLGGFFHMLYLGKPLRGWRILLKFGNSELSRGLWIIGLFAAFGFLQVVPYGIPDVLPWGWDSPLLSVITGVLSVLVIMHGFTTMFVMRALPAWNSSMMIPLSLASGLWVGSQGVAFLGSVAGIDTASAQTWARWTLFIFIGALGVYLWGMNHSSENARASLRRMLAGDLSATFYIGVLGVGLLVPVILTLGAWDGMGTLLLRFLCVFAGDASMRYCVMRAPVYSPLV